MKKIINRRNVFLFVILLIIGGLIATTGYFYNEYQKVKKNPDLIAKEEIKSVTDSIKRFMELPSDEEPTLATITDKEKLKDQEFFKNAQNGDKVLIYTKAKKAILYRPSTGRVIEFAPLILGPKEGTTESSQSNQTQPISVAIYNGTQTPGLTAEYEKKLSGIEGLSVVKKANAAKNDYTETIVVDITGTNSEMVRNIAKIVGGAVKSLPDGETKPQADVLVIASQK